MKQQKMIMMMSSSPSTKKTLEIGMAYSFFDVQHWPALTFTPVVVAEEQITQLLPHLMVAQHLLLV
jgi:hypothetical protein